MSEDKTGSWEELDAQMAARGDRSHIFNPDNPPRSMEECNYVHIQLLAELDRDIDRHYQAANRLADAERDWLKKAASVRFVSRERLQREKGIEKSTDLDRDAYVHTVCEKEYFRYRYTKAMASASGKVMEARQTQIKAMQSIAKNIRDEMNWTDQEWVPE